MELAIGLVLEFEKVVRKLDHQVELRGSVNGDQGTWNGDQGTDFGYSQELLIADC